MQNQFLQLKLRRLLFYDYKQQRITATHQQQQIVIPLAMFRLEKISGELLTVESTEFTYSVAIGNKKTGETYPRRHPKAVYGLLDVEKDFEGMFQHLGDLWDYLVEQYQDKKLLREITFAQADRQVKILGSWFLTQKHEKMYLYCRNSPEWTITDLASWNYGVVTIPLYDTLGNQAFSHIVGLTEGTVIFTTADMCETLFNKLSGMKDCKIRQIVIIGQLPYKTAKTFNEKLGMKVTLFSEIMQNDKILLRPTLKMDSHLTYSFTSGTTGLPKGVICTHRNVLSQLLSMPNFINYSETDVHLSYLPIAHIFERYVIWMAIFYGCSIQYCNYGATDILKDLHSFKPTVIPIVPRLLNKLYPMMKNIYQNEPNGQETVKMLFGGRLRTMITASAPVSAQILTFFKKVLECEVREAYGQTQTTALSFCTHPFDTNYGHVGGPNPSFEMKLVSVPEMNYDAETSPPRGQICLRGPSIFVGYYKDQKNTSENIDQEGWSHTGDIGMFLPNGALKIIDRKKNIYKLSQGQYVAPEKVENIYVRCEYVAECFLYGDSLRDYNVAIIHPNPELLPKLAEKLGILSQFEESGKFNIEKMCNNEQIVKFVYSEIQKQAKKDGLFGFETAKKIRLWPVSLGTYGIFTSTMKLQRHIAKKTFEEEIKKMYEQEKFMPKL